MSPKAVSAGVLSLAIMVGGEASAASLHGYLVASRDQVVPTFTWEGLNGFSVDPLDADLTKFSLSNAALGQVKMTATATKDGFAAYVISVNVPYLWTGEKRIGAALVSKQVDRLWIVNNGGTLIDGVADHLLLLSQRSRLASRDILRAFNADPTGLTTHDVIIASYFLISSANLVGTDYFVDRDDDMSSVADFVQTQINKNPGLFPDGLIEQDQNAIHTLANARRTQVGYIASHIVGDLGNKYKRKDACDRIASLNSFLAGLPDENKDDFGGNGRNRVTALAGVLNCAGDKLGYLPDRLKHLDEVKSAVTEAQADIDELHSVLAQFEPAGDSQGVANDEAATRLAEAAADNLQKRIDEWRPHLPN